MIDAKNLHFRIDDAINDNADRPSFARLKTGSTSSWGCEPKRLIAYSCPCPMVALRA